MRVRTDSTERRWDPRMKLFYQGHSMQLERIVSLWSPDIVGRTYRQTAISAEKCKISSWDGCSLRIHVYT